MLEQQDHRDTQEKKETKESLDLPDPLEHQVHLAPLGHPDPEDFVEMKVQLVQQEITDQLVYQDNQVPVEPKDLKEPQVQLAKLVLKV